MAISLKNTQVEQVLHELARETGESLTEAAGAAFRERLERMKRERARAVERSRVWVSELIAEARASQSPSAVPLKDATDELWGE